MTDREDFYAARDDLARNIRKAIVQGFGCEEIAETVMMCMDTRKPSPDLIKLVWGTQ